MNSKFVLRFASMMILGAVFAGCAVGDTAPEDEEDVGQVEQPLPKNPCFTTCARDCWDYWYTICHQGCAHTDYSCQNTCMANFDYCQADCYAWCGS